LVQGREGGLISSGDLSPRALEFFTYFRSEWQPVEWAERGVWWRVPKWSLPAWKALGVSVTDSSGLVAFKLAHDLLANPDRLLTPAAVEVLLKRAQERYWYTANEARGIRDAELASDLQELVRKRFALLDMPGTLDALATMGEVSSKAIAAA